MWCAVTWQYFSQLFVKSEQPSTLYMHCLVILKQSNEALKIHSSEFDVSHASFTWIRCFTCLLHMNSMFHMPPSHEFDVSHASFTWIRCFTCLLHMNSMFHMPPSHEFDVSHASFTWIRCFTCLLHMNSMFHMPPFTGLEVTECREY